MENCKICQSNFHASPDELVVCDHKDGLVHKGCCTGLCSWDGKPCEHGLAFYTKIIK